MRDSPLSVKQLLDILLNNFLPYVCPWHGIYKNTFSKSSEKSF